MPPGQRPIGITGFWVVPFSGPAASTCVQELDDNELLRQYVDAGSGEAFANLVTRHVDKVYSVALRHTRNPHQAEEITQAVFVLLAMKARRLGRKVVLSGWLYQTARLTAVTTIRSEIRRARREMEAHMQNTPDPNETESDAWARIAPLLDSAMAGLNETDRHALVLRFLDGRSMGAVGAALGASEEAARKRVHRAVEKLRRHFFQRGVVLPAAALTTAISANSVQAAPAGLAKAISTVAVAQGAAAASGSLLVLAKGLLKPLLTAASSTWAAFAPLLGSIFFTLMAEVEQSESPRERRFIIRMIWLRFTLAILAMSVPLGIGLAAPALFERPGVIEFGFAGFALLGAIECSVRTIYFDRRRRQIQIEDGTWEECGPVASTEPRALLAALRDRSSKPRRYAALAAACALSACILVTLTSSFRLIAGGQGVLVLLVLCWGAFASRRTIRHWNRMATSISGSQMGRVVAPVLCFAAMSLFLFNASWLHGRLPLGFGWAIGFNVLLAVVYLVLIKGLQSVRSIQRS